MSNAAPLREKNGAKTIYEETRARKISRRRFGGRLIETVQGWREREIGCEGLRGDRSEPIAMKPRNKSTRKKNVSFLMKRRPVALLKLHVDYQTLMPLRLGFSFLEARLASTT